MATVAMTTMVSSKFTTAPGSAGLQPGCTWCTSQLPPTMMWEKKKKNGSNSHNPKVNFIDQNRSSPEYCDNCFWSAITYARQFNCLTASHLRQKEIGSRIGGKFDKDASVILTFLSDVCTYTTQEAQTSPSGLSMPVLPSSVKSFHDRIFRNVVEVLCSCAFQIGPHVDTTVVLTWEAAPAGAPVSTMATVAMTTTVSNMSCYFHPVLH